MKPTDMSQRAEVACASLVLTGFVLLFARFVAAGCVTACVGGACYAALAILCGKFSRDIKVCELDKNTDIRLAELSTPRQRVV